MLIKTDSCSVADKNTSSFLNQCAERRVEARKKKGRELMRLMDIIGNDAQEAGITDADIEAVLNEK